MTTSDHTVRPVFVLGMARSGTTLVGTIVGAHPGITIAPETHFLDKCADPFLDLDMALRANFDKAWGAYSASGRFSALGLDADALAARITASDAIDFKTMYGHVLRAYAERFGTPRWGDKSHVDHRYIDWLLEWYPACRIICVVRDPRATVSSLLKTPWSSGYAFYYAQQWRETADILARFKGCDRVYLVKYESIVQQPEREARALCAFLGEMYSPLMLERPEDPAPIADRTTWELEGWWRQHKRKALEPVSMTSLEKWRANLSPYEVAVVEHIARDGMREFGYAATTTALGLGYALRLRFEILGRFARAAVRPSRLVARLRAQRTIHSPRPW
ncbi:MAG TPA: sulfotransferase [Candidatus Hydrogenedentes bacterium]|nr:sulfotransferase [Candidatus Hydrogenedentota bacterium]HIJ74784.1 sulfotransferase [Candidatus Hydrogenedentota bacterium]